MARGEFFKRIVEAQQELGIGRQGGWFRGVKKAVHKLEPSMLRHPGLEHVEHNLMARFVRQGARYLDTTDKWARLAFMQHYGVPTKLMDWTTDLTSAIYFALAYNAKSDKDIDGPHVWVLNPFRLNGLDKSAGKRMIFDNMDEIPEYKPKGILKDNDWPYKLPIAIAVDWRDRRIEHQRGVFTYHGTDGSPLDKLVGGLKPKCLVKVSINKDEIEDLLAHLRDAGITHHRMLQDPDSLGLDIKNHALGSINAETDILWGKRADVPPVFMGGLTEEG
jgi:hypothetical protein